MKFNFMLEEPVHSKQGMGMPITWQTPGGKGTLPSSSESAPVGCAREQQEQGCSTWEDEQGHHCQGAAL